MLSKLIAAVALAAPSAVFAQNMLVYSNALENGWQNWGWTTLNYANTSPVYATSQDSISVLITNAYAGIQLYHPDMDSTPYTGVSFYLHGGATGGQSLQAYGILDVSGTPNAAQSGRYYLSAPAANTWQQYTVPLSALGVANAPNFTGFVIQDSAGSTEPIFYLDDIQLVAAGPPPPPPSPHLTVNAGQAVRTADQRWFGLNATIWDGNLNAAQTLALMTNMGVRGVRFPGGSDSDDYHWLYDRQDLDDWNWLGDDGQSLASYIQVMTNLNAQSMVTVNYGTGTPNEAAAWVAYVNAATTNTHSLGTDANGFNWQTAGYWASLRTAAPLESDDGLNFLRISRTAPLGFKYWEIGNEEYGSWETDSNSIPHDPYTYAVRAQAYISQMKAVDPTIKIGVVITPGFSGYVNNTDHAATDPVTEDVYYGWTPVLMWELNSLAVTPDFAIYHRYPQNPGGETDSGLLADSPTGWANDAASLRTIINDYMGVAAGTNIELVCTENNSVSSSPGRQSASLVNGLYRLDSFACMMQTEFNGLFWWALRNGVETDGNLSTSLYGWRAYGDYGIVDSGFNNVYPSYYDTVLLTKFIQAGDTVLGASSDYSLLPAYGVRRQDGSLTLLVINKDPTNTLTGQVAIAGFTPSTNVAVYSYGIPQDQAAEYGTGSSNIALTAIDVTGTNFNYNFAPYSATVMSFSPSPAALQNVSHTASQFVVQVQGQGGTPYVVETATNLVNPNWTPVSTNTLTGSSMNITNPVTPGVPQKFWRAVWQP